MASHLAGVAVVTKIQGGVYETFNSIDKSKEGIIATGESANTDTVVASAKAYINALNRVIVRRGKVGEGVDTREISYKDVT